MTGVQTCALPISDIPALQSARADALRSATMSNKKARIAYLNDQGEVCIVSLKKPLSEKWESFVKSNMADAGENGVRGIVINKKAKGLKLNEENFLELPRKMTAERTQLFNDIKNLVRERGDLSPYLRNLRGNITREDIEILRQIPAENKLLLDDYLTLRDNLSASSLHKDYAAVSLRHNPDAGTPQFLLRRADQTTSVHSVDMNGKVPDFSTLSDRLESAETLNEFKKATMAEGQFISEVYKTAKCNTLITIEDASGGISSAKIAALHESLPPQGRILRDNPDLDQSVRFFKENVYPELASTIILTSSENFYFSDDMIDSLQFQRVVLKKAATYADFLAALKNPSFRQIILITESDPYEDYMNFNKEEATLLFADNRAVKCREIADELRKLDHVKDYVYIRAPEAQTAQQAFARTSRVKRVIAETYFPGNPIDFLMDFLKTMMPGKASSKNSLDNILNDLTKKGVGLSRKSSFKGDFDSIFRSIPDIKAEIISEKFSRF